jgi:FixJ family two-component response regulator
MDTEAAKSAAGKGHVFIVDDDPSVRTSLARLLRSHDLNVEVFASARAFLEGRPRRRVPSCIVLDVRMPELDGLELQKALTSHGFCAPIIFVSGHGDVPTTVRAMKGGAIDFLSKPIDEQDLLDAIRQALVEDEKHHAQRSEKEEILERIRHLTPRELEVLRHVISGRLNKQIALALGIAEKTVKVHRGRGMEKMAADSVADLVRLMEQAGVARIDAGPISPAEGS